MILLLILVILLFGFGGYRLGGPDNGPYVSVGTILLIILVLYLLGFIGPGTPLRIR